MYNASMIRVRVISVLAATVIGSSLGAIPARAANTDAGDPSTFVQLAQSGCTMFGPYATMGRANEVAAEARSYGYSAVAFHNGDGYYVRVC
jgi:hypothetical protein